MLSNVKQAKLSFDQTTSDMLSPEEQSLSNIPILDKLYGLARKEFLFKSELEENEEVPMPSAESVIPSLLKQEHHNYIIIDSSGVTIKTDKGIETLWPFPISDPGIEDTYKKWSDYLNKRLLPFDVGQELAKFSKNSIKLCYDGYYIAEWKDIQSIDDTECFEFVPGNLNGANLERQTISKFILVKIQGPEKKRYRINVHTERLFPGQGSCLDPSLLCVKNKNSCSNNNSTQNEQHEASNCSEKSLENGQCNSKNICLPCKMVLFLATRKILKTEKSELVKMRNVERFTFKYCCETKNERVIMLCVAKTQTDNFCIVQTEEDLKYFFNKETIEVGKQNDVDRLIHSVYHKCLNESSGALEVLHKFNDDDEYQKIIFKPLTIETEERKENPEVSLVHVSHIEVPENSLGRKHVVSGDTNKSKCVPFDKVHRWIEAKKIYKFKLEEDPEPLIDSKDGREDIFLDINDLLKKAIRLKRLLEENPVYEEMLTPELRALLSLDVDITSNNQTEKDVTSIHNENSEKIIKKRKIGGEQIVTVDNIEISGMSSVDEGCSKDGEGSDSAEEMIVDEKSSGNITNSDHENEEMIVDLSLEESPGNKTDSISDFIDDIRNTSEDNKELDALFPVDMSFDNVPLEPEIDDDFDSPFDCSVQNSQDKAPLDSVTTISGATAEPKTDVSEMETQSPFLDILDKCLKNKTLWESRRRSVDTG